MTSIGFTLFDTPLGRCAVAWSARGATGLQLPEQSEAATRTTIERRFPAARFSTASPEIQLAIDEIVALLRGKPVDLSQVVIDLEGVPPFHQRVYEVTRTIAPGSTLSYGELAVRLGVPGAARAVGQALGRNPVPILIPCHRVVAAGGGTGGFSAPGGAATKRRLLAIERACQPGQTRALFV